MQGNMKMHILILDLCFIFLRFCIWNMIIKIVIYRDTRIYIHAWAPYYYIFMDVLYNTVSTFNDMDIATLSALSKWRVKSHCDLTERKRVRKKKNPQQKKIYILVSEGLNWKCNFSTFRETGGKEELDISSLFKVNILISSHTCYYMCDRQRSLSTLMYTAQQRGVKKPSSE